MLRISDRSTPDCMVVQVEGAIRGDDYDGFEDAFEAAVEADGRVNLVVELLGPVKYGDMDAVEEDAEFVIKDYKKVRRAAFVGDQTMIMRMLKVFARLTRAEEGFYSSGELDAAIEWASAGEAPRKE